MADNTQQTLLESTNSNESSTTEDISKWQPYWDEHYKRYYWSDGNESVSQYFSLNYWVTGTSPIRLSPIGHSPMTKVQGYIDESPLHFRQQS